MGEGRGRLVHDDDARLVRQRAGDLHEVLLRDRQAAHRRGRIEIGLELREERPGAGVHRRQSIDAEARLRAGPTRRCSRRRKIVEHGRFLMDRGDAEASGVLRRAQAHGRAVDEDCAVVRRVEAGEDLDQGRLAGAVLADQRRHLAAAQLERAVDERLYAREGLRDAAECSSTGSASPQASRKIRAKGKARPPAPRRMADATGRSEDLRELGNVRLVVDERDRSSRPRPYRRRSTLPTRPIGDGRTWACPSRRARGARRSAPPNSRDRSDSRSRSSSPCPCRRGRRAQMAGRGR